jgi:hypothetical protein
MLALNLITVFLYVMNSLYLIKKYPRNAILFGYVFFFQGWSIISSYYNDLGFYNSELFVYTETSYATARLALFYIVFNLGFWLTGLMIGKRSTPKIRYNFPNDSIFFFPSKEIIKAIYIISFCYLIYSFTTNGIPVLGSWDRVYIYNSLDELQKNFLSYGFILIFIIGFLRGINKYVYINDFLLVGFLLYLVSIGNKFSVLLEFSIIYVTPIWIIFISKASKTFSFPKNLFFLIFAGIFLVIIIALFHYSEGFTNFEAGKQLLIDRIFSLQGHLWWAVDNQVSNSGTYDPEHWVFELRAILTPGSISEDLLGMKYLMSNIISQEEMAKLIERGYLYTMAYPAILIASGPYWVGLLFQLFAGAFLFAILSYLANCVCYGRIFPAVIALTIVFPFTSLLGSGVFSTFFRFGILIKFILLAYLELRYFLLKSRKSQIV